MNVVAFVLFVAFLFLGFLLIRSFLRTDVRYTRTAPRTAATIL